MIASVRKIVLFTKTIASLDEKLVVSLAEVMIGKFLNPSLVGISRMRLSNSCAALCSLVARLTGARWFTIKLRSSNR